MKKINKLFSLSGTASSFLSDMIEELRDICWTEEKTLLALDDLLDADYYANDEEERLTDDEILELEDKEDRLAALKERAESDKSNFPCRANLIIILGLLKGLEKTPGFRKVIYKDLNTTIKDLEKYV